MRPDRRRFVLGSLAGLGWLPRSLRPLAPLGAREERGRTLVLIQLTGGNDGLSTLVPHADDEYGRARTSIRIEPGRVLPLDERVGLHPALAGLRTRFENGQLALFEGVGYPDPNRSHFRSRDIWHAADPRGRALGEGWIGRLLDSWEDAAPEAVVHIGANAPFSLFSRRRPPVTLAGLGFDHAPAEDGSAVMEDEQDSPLEYVRRAAQDSRRAAAAFRQALEGYRAPDDYSGSPFCQDLSTAAALIHADLGVRVCSVELDGFDTHADQRARHDRLMADLDRGLTAFASDLERSERGRETVVLAYSEFGRRLAENGSRGTDHGAAGLALALGGPVRGGLFGAPPDLARLERGDPVFTTDFRSLYAALLERVFGVDAAALLGSRFAIQDWLA